MRSAVRPSSSIPRMRTAHHPPPLPEPSPAGAGSATRFLQQPNPPLRGMEWTQWVPIFGPDWGGSAPTPRAAATTINTASEDHKPSDAPTVHVTTVRHLPGDLQRPTSSAEVSHTAGYAVPHTRPSATPVMVALRPGLTLSRAQNRAALQQITLSTAHIQHRWNRWGFGALAQR